ncbi:hypothetical protein [Vibrio penaeicida]|uniref:Uncharacterized protein n=1 Tax=Vibrio penaeicida TaxID=104609 RepID=A0AAV5NZE2_9VIBR|nr:hypothetical protein [Vibrio penaeicida]RTZ22977.1 hypothetical protein EKN09_11355 [Vibrio penaeicida]GLQ75683.1 hypothetical protein GCM10007932_50460 [Vibrio penaeicida]
MSKIILYFVLILGVAAVVFLDDKNPSQQNQKVKQGTENNTGSHSSRQNDTGRYAKKEIESSAVKQLSNNNTANSSRAVADTNSLRSDLGEDIHLEIEEPWFEVTDTLPIDKVKPLSVGDESLSAIEFRNIGEFSSLSSGDSVRLLLPNGEEVLISITQDKKQVNNTKTWSGIFKSNGYDYPAVFTFGKKNVFGFIGHPDAEYKVTGLNNTAWLYEVPQEYFEEPSPQ